MRQEMRQLDQRLCVGEVTDGDLSHFSRFETLRCPAAYQGLCDAMIPATGRAASQFQERGPRDGAAES
jgi:hypothetical protein